MREKTNTLFTSSLFKMDFNRSFLLDCATKLIFWSIFSTVVACGVTSTLAGLFKIDIALAGLRTPVLLMASGTGHDALGYQRSAKS